VSWLKIALLVGLVGCIVGLKLVDTPSQAAALADGSPLVPTSTR
jgi:xanthosine utilization system XapX-like protein